MIPRLQLILDLEVVAGSGHDPVQLACAAVAGGVGAVHLRSRACPAGALLEWASRLRVALAGRALLLVNDRLDVALAAAADGVQLPGVGLPPAAARALARTWQQGAGTASHEALAGWESRTQPLLIGCSVHDAAAARMATGDGADFLLVGTVFASHSHPERAPGGDTLVRAVRAATTLPLIAIGGITPVTAAHAMAAGADGVAVMRAVIEAPDPTAAAGALSRELVSARADALA
ncbi:MAG TPA: thiamine phosphate synthase [Chloroflexota bacterium]|nr:thiamine phosphate synthase [Chloroflexota bacterium]